MSISVKNKPVARPSPAPRPQIGTYLRRSRAVILLVVVPAVVAGAVAYLLLSSQPRQVFASATVVAPDSAGNSPGAIGLYVADFEQTLRGDALASIVTADTDISVGEYQAGIRAVRVGQSSAIDVSYSTTGDDALPVLERALSSIALLMAEPPLERAQQRFDETQAEYEAAKVELRSAVEETNVLNADAEYQAAKARRDSLALELAQLGAREFPTPLQAQEARQQHEVITDQLAVLDEQISELLALSFTRQPIEEEIDYALAFRNDSRRDLSAAQTQYERDRILRFLEEPDQRTLSSTVRTVQGIVAAASLAALIGFGLLLLTQYLTRPRGTAAQGLTRAQT